MNTVPIMSICYRYTAKKAIVLVLNNLLLPRNGAVKKSQEDYPMSKFYMLNQNHRNTAKYQALVAVGDMITLSWVDDEMKPNRSKKAVLFAQRHSRTTISELLRQHNSILLNIALLPRSQRLKKSGQPLQDTVLCLGGNSRQQLFDATEWTRKVLS